MKYYKPTFKINTIISAKDRNEALEKLKELPMEVEELPNVAIWQLKTKDGEFLSTGKVTFNGPHRVKKGMKHYFQEQKLNWEHNPTQYTGKVVEIKQEENRFYFICQEIGRVA